MAIFQLPCGYLDPEEGIHTALQEVELRELTGYEEDILADKNKNTHDSVNEVLSRCMVRLGNIQRTTDRRDKFFVAHLDKMMSQDRGFLVIQLRVMSLGGDFKFAANCPIPDCRNRHPRMTVDLSTLEVIRMDRPEVREWTVETPSGASVTYRALYGHDEVAVRRMVKDQARQLTTALLHLRIVQIDGEPPKVDAIKALSSRDRDFLRAQFEKNEGGIETEIEIECEKCGCEWKTQLPIGSQSFFFPSAIGN